MVDINSDIEIIGVSIKNTNERTKEKEVIVKYKVKDIYNVSSNIDLSGNVLQEDLLHFISDIEKHKEKYKEPLINNDCYINQGFDEEEELEYDYRDFETDYDVVEQRGFVL